MIDLGWKLSTVRQTLQHNDFRNLPLLKPLCWSVWRTVLGFHLPFSLCCTRLSFVLVWSMPVLCGMIALQNMPHPGENSTFPCPCCSARLQKKKNRSYLQPWTGQHLFGDAEDQKPSTFAIWWTDVDLQYLPIISRHLCKRAATTPCGILVLSSLLFVLLLLAADLFFLLLLLCGTHFPWIFLLKLL